MPLVFGFQDLHPGTDQQNSEARTLWLFRSLPVPMLEQHEQRTVSLLTMCLSVNPHMLSL